MNSITEEIKKMRSDSSFNVDRTNNNRYAVVLDEDNSTKTAYFFTAPLYNNVTKKAVSMNFFNKDGDVHAVGTNAEITISDSIRLKNDESYFVMPLREKITHSSSKSIYASKDEIFPTLNGIAYKCYINGQSSIDFEFEVGKTYYEIRSNDKYVSLMRERFQPFVTISCIGCINAANEIVAPVKISYFRTNQNKYRITLYPCSLDSKWILFEINLYEEKLMLDTTVESYHPSINNAFGSIAFIGNTSEFGEQWLYSRPDFYKLNTLDGKYINKAILHIPRFNTQKTNMDSYGVFARFCSFGSNWSNKKKETNRVSSAIEHGNYWNIDFKGIVTDNNGRFKMSEGMILKPRKYEEGFAVISTGDSSYAPQILEINYSMI